MKTTLILRSKCVVCYSFNYSKSVCVGRNSNRLITCQKLHVSRLSAYNILINVKFPTINDNFLWSSMFLHVWCQSWQVKHQNFPLLSQLFVWLEAAFTEFFFSRGELLFFSNCSDSKWINSKQPLVFGRYDLMTSSPSFCSHGRLPRPTRVGACWAVWCGEIPVPDPWSARARHQLGKRQPSCGHQGWEVGPNHITAWHSLETAALYRSFTRSHHICFLLSCILLFSLSLIGTLFCPRGFCRLQECVTRTAESSAVWLITVQGWNTVLRHFSLFQVGIFDKSHIQIPSVARIHALTVNWLSSESVFCSGLWFSPL